MESNVKKDDNRNSSYTCYSGIYANTCFCWKFHSVGLLTLLDIDCGCCTVGTRHEISVKEIIKHCWEPTVAFH